MADPLTIRKCRRPGCRGLYLQLLFSRTTSNCFLIGIYTQDFGRALHQLCTMASSPQAAIHFNRDYDANIFWMNCSAWRPYLFTYCWCELASLPVQQYGSVLSQYDWMISGFAGEHLKPAGRAANWDKQMSVDPPILNRTLAAVPRGHGHENLRSSLHSSTHPVLFQAERGPWFKWN